MIQLRTIKLIAQWIADKTGVNIQFIPNAIPCANSKQKRIILPTAMDERSVYAGIALIMHEAGHIRYSGELEAQIRNICDDAVDKELINALEDVRIDRKSINILPSTKEFYTELNGSGWDKCDLNRIPKSRIALLFLMDQSLGISHAFTHKFRGLLDQSTFSGIHVAFNNALMALTSANDFGGEWSKVKDKVHELRKAMGIAPPQPQPTGGHDGQTGEGQQGQTGEQEQDKTSQTGNKQTGKGTGEREKTEGEEGNVGKNADAVQQPDGNGRSTGKPSGSNTKDDIDKVRGRSISFSDIFGCKGATELHEGELLSYDAFEEQTKQELKEKLNIKQTKIVNQGQSLDTNNLLAFFTGDTDELFVDEKIIKKKKSKILFLLDSSYSMDEQTFGSDKRNILIKAVKGIVDCLEEVKELEGINVDYQVDAFDDEYHNLNPNSWEREYRCQGGGTNIHTAFKQALESIANDYTITGKRIFIVFSDGEVYDWQVEGLKKIIQEQGHDVRLMIVGIGCVQKEFRELIGDFNILLEQESQTVIAEAIKECL